MNIKFNRIATIFCVVALLSFQACFAQNVASNSLRLIGSLPPEQINQQIIVPSMNEVDRKVLVSLYAMLWAANDFVTNPPDPSTTRGMYAQNNLRILMPYKAQIQKTMVAANDTMAYLGSQIGVSGAKFKQALGIEEVIEPKACDRCDPAYVTLKIKAYGGSQNDMVYKGLMDFNDYMRNPGTATTKTTPEQPAFELAPSAFFPFYQGFYPEYYRLRAAPLAQTAAKVEVALENQEKVQIANQQAIDKRNQWFATPEGQKYQAEQAAAEKRKNDAEQAALQREFPYYALITCEYDNQNFNVSTCFSSNIGTELEVRNGSDYNMYKGNQVMWGEAGKLTPQGLYINLRNTFTLRAQNSSNNMLLGMKIYDRKSGKILYQKKAGLYETIYISN